MIVFNSSNNFICETDKIKVHVNGIEYRITSTKEGILKINTCGSICVFPDSQNQIKVIDQESFNEKNKKQ